MLIAAVAGAGGWQWSFVLSNGIATVMGMYPCMRRACTADPGLTMSG